MQHHWNELETLTLQAAFLKASKEFTEAAKKRISIDELSRMYEGVREIYEQIKQRKHAAEPALS